jgi:hypothetical protein
MIFRIGPPVYGPFYSILFYSILFYSILFYSILFYPIWKSYQILTPFQIVHHFKLIDFAKHLNTYCI